MKIKYKDVQQEFDRDIYWIKITFIDDTNEKHSIVAAGASTEYLEDYYKVKNKNRIEEKHFDDWKKRIIEKWKSFGDELYNYKIHYDSYANTKKGEANIIDFLIKANNT